MKTNFLRITLIALILAACTTAAPPASAEPTPEAQWFHSRGLVGTWEVTVNRESAPPGSSLSFKTLQSFLSGGVMLETSSGTMLRSAGHGVWKRTGPNEYVSTFWFYRFDASGAPTGSQKTRRVIKVEDGQYFATSEVAIYNPAGTVVATGRATETGHRLTND